MVPPKTLVETCPHIATQPNLQACARVRRHWSGSRPATKQPTTHAAVVVYRHGLPYPEPLWLRQIIDRCERRASTWRWHIFAVSVSCDREQHELTRAYQAHLRNLDLIANRARATLAEMGESISPRGDGSADAPVPSHRARMSQGGQPCQCLHQLIGAALLVGPADRRDYIF